LTKEREVLVERLGQILRDAPLEVLWELYLIARTLTG